MRKDKHASSNNSRAGVAILITNKIDSKIRNVTKDKERHT